MIQQQAIVTKLHIDKARQVKHFQVNLPKDTQYVTGIELGCFWNLQQPWQNREPKIFMVDFNQSLLMGEIRLQSCEQNNIFYAGHVTLDGNLAMADFSLSPTWIPRAFTHQAKAFEEPVRVSGESTILYGIYRDRYFEQSSRTPDYIIQVYVWVDYNKPISK